MYVVCVLFHLAWIYVGVGDSIMNEEQIQREKDRDAIRKLTQAVKDSGGSYIFEAFIIAIAISAGATGIVNAINGIG